MNAVTRCHKTNCLHRFGTDFDRMIKRTCQLRHNRHIYSRRHYGAPPKSCQTIKFDIWLLDDNNQSTRFVIVMNQTRAPLLLQNVCKHTKKRDVIYDFWQVFACLMARFDGCVSVQISFQITRVRFYSFRLTHRQSQLLGNSSVPACLHHHRFYYCVNYEPIKRSIRCS